MLEQLLKNIEI